MGTTAATRFADFKLIEHNSSLKSLFELDSTEVFHLSRSAWKSA